MTPKLNKLNSVGEIYHDFQVTKIVEIHELQSVLRELVHLPTGAHVMHLANEDPENLFCISFQTLPDSSNGVAHILEHTVLCGSEKYPVKDPFFAMTRRSLNTYMNALTGADFTCYPAASQVPKDFYNLLEVYIDAVFHPNLNELSFLQEGHRLEFSEPDNPNSHLVHKGIVFNEMKGALTSSTTRLLEAINQELYPDLPYGYNSGGDPKVIPSLSYTELCAFHQQHYHPSRAIFFFYGNMPLEGHLDFIAKHALKNVRKLDPLPPLPLQPRFTQPKYVAKEYPVSPDEDLSDKTMISFGWLTCHILKQQDVLALCILEIILMDTDASPLKLALLKSGFCKQASAIIDIDMSEVPILLNIKGCSAEDADAIEKVIKETLLQIAEEGIPLHQIENAIHQLEFHRSEITGNHTPFGLSLFMRSALLKQHGGNAEDGLVIHTLFDQIRKNNLEDSNYFSNLIRKYFLENNHFVRLVMTPNRELNSKETEEEQKDLEKIRKEMTPGQIKQTMQKALALSEFQKKQEEEDDSILPKISLEDVPLASRNIPLLEETIEPFKVYHHNCFTNEIVYADLVYNLPDLPEQDLPLVRLFTTLVSQMGVGGRTYEDTLEYIQAHTGGIGSYLALYMQADDDLQYIPSLGIRGKALYRKANKLFPMIADMVNQIDFTNLERLKEILMKQYISLNSALGQSGLRYAINLSASALDHSSKVMNKFYGLDYYHAIKEIVENIDKELKPLSEKLQFLHKHLVGLTNPDLILTCDAEMYDEIKRHRFYGLQEIPTNSYTHWKGNFPLDKVESQGRIIASPVAFISHVIKTVPYNHPDAAALSIASALFDNLVLHPAIREKGGAYGGGSTANALSGNLYFYSYRDPNISISINAFDMAVKIIAEGNFEESDLEEAKLEVIQGLDGPIAPGSRGDVAYAWMREGRTLEMRQTYRNRLLSATREQVISAVKQQILPRLNTGAVVVFAGKELLEKENAYLIAQNKTAFQLNQV